MGLLNADPRTRAPPRGRRREGHDEDAECYRIRLEVSNRVFGFLFGYEGAFTCDFPPATDAPERLKPRRHEHRA